MINLGTSFVTAAVSALVAALSTLLIEFFAKPSLEARKERSLARVKLERTLLAELSELTVRVASLSAERISAFRLKLEKPEHDFSTIFPHEKQFEDITRQLEAMTVKYSELDVLSSQTVTDGIRGAIYTIGYTTRFRSGGEADLGRASLKQYVDRTLLICELLDRIFSALLEAQAALRAPHRKKPPNLSKRGRGAEDLQLASKRVKELCPLYRIELMTDPVTRQTRVAQIGNAPQ